jgi:hypothetical protein
MIILDKITPALSKSFLHLNKKSPAFKMMAATRFHDGAAEGFKITPQTKGHGNIILRVPNGCLHLSSNTFEAWQAACLIQKFIYWTFDQLTAAQSLNDQGMREAAR